MQNPEKIEEDLTNCLCNIDTIHGLSRILKNLIFDELGDIKQSDVVSLAEIIEENLKKEKRNIDNIKTALFGL